MNNYHCSVVQIKNVGIMITGDSGTGKSSLTMGLLEYCQRSNWQGKLVCDDQALLEANADHTELIAYAPKTISGLVEIHGFGVSEVDFIEQTKVDLVVKLVEQSTIVRMPEPEITNICSVELPLLLTPRQHEAQGVRIISAWVKSHVNA